MKQNILLVATLTWVAVFLNPASLWAQAGAASAGGLAAGGSQKAQIPAPHGKIADTQDMI